MTRLGLWALLGCIVACSSDPHELGAAQEAIINGNVENGYDEVVAVVSVDSRGNIRGICSGTTIGTRSVLTAKHCVYDVDGTGGAQPASRLRVLVGTNVNRMSGIEHVIDVESWRATDGVYSDDDLTNGDDVAVVRTRTDIPTPVRELARSSARVGMPITIVGFGRTGSGAFSPTGRKYSGTTTVALVARKLFQTSGTSHTCQGDSGGPAFDANGRVLGVTSFGTDPTCREDASYYSEVQAHLGWIAEELGGSAPCTSGPQMCNGADDNCDGTVDEGCGMLGASCREDDECAEGACRPAEDGFICVADCDPDNDQCPTGYVCAPRACGSGLCVVGAPGPGAVGQACDEDADCASYNCFTRASGLKVCARQCYSGSAPCPGTLVCQNEGNICGACLPDASEPLPLGSACAANDECESGICSEESFCTQPCSTHEECPGYRCDGTNCAMGEPLGAGAPCEQDIECVDGADCVEVDGSRMCASDCTESGCGLGEECIDGSCMPDGEALGVSCEEGSDCRSGICAGTCTQVCDEDNLCPDGFECRPAGSVSGCFLPADEGGGGCQVGSTGTAQWLPLLALLLFRRRR